MPDRNTDGLKIYAQNKKEVSHNKALDAIASLYNQKKKVNFNTVSIEAGVTKAYLYKTLDVREKIEQIRSLQENLPSPKLLKANMSDTSKDVLIAALQQKIKILKEDKKRLEQENEKLRGKIYDDI